MSTRVCNTCKQEKELERDFSKDRTKREGYAVSCKECRKRYPKRKVSEVKTLVETRAEVVEIDAQGKLQQEVQEKKKREAQTLAIKTLIENHPREFAQLIARFNALVGVQPTWRAVS